MVCIRVEEAQTLPHEADNIKQSIRHCQRVTTTRWLVYCLVVKLPVVEHVHLASGQTDTGPRSIAAVKTLRLSITDRCNFRCVYCMPENGVEWLAKDSLLTLEEIVRVARAAFEIHGIAHFKLTGGEPTVRRGVVDLVRQLRAIHPSLQLSMTTNGFALAELAHPLRQAGLDRVTVSIDSLQPEKFKQITRTGDLPTVIKGVHSAIDAGFEAVKINCVAMKGINHDELAEFARLTLDMPVMVRFIEYMPLGDSQLTRAGAEFVEVTDDRGTRFAAVSPDEIGPQAGCGGQLRGDVFIPQTDIIAAIESTLGPIVEEYRLPTDIGPAVPFKLQHGTPVGRLGFISAMSAPFCSTCNRLRLTAQGVLRSCLFEGGEVELRNLLRAGATDQQLALAMVECVAKKPQVHSHRGFTPMSQIGG
jgi:GTP 3',8-cyclase